eukprot:6618745-Prymnesium_polylepis.1
MPHVQPIAPARSASAGRRPAKAYQPTRAHAHAVTNGRRQRSLSILLQESLLQKFHLKNPEKLVYKKDAAERILQRAPTPGEEEVDMKITEALAIAWNIRALVVEGVVETVERKAWGDADSDMGGQEGRHEYTLVMLAHS